MELTFNHIKLNCYRPIHQCVHTQEETQEAIVPDACPDILRVVASCGRISLRGVQAREGSASATGVVTAVVLYQPEGESALRRIEVNLPFDAAVTVPALTPAGHVNVVTHLRGVEGRVLNPRKLLIRGEIALELSAYEPEELSICDGASSDGYAGIQQSQVEQKAYFITAVQEKPFTFTEQIRLAGQGDIGEVMTMRATPICNESKQIGNKLVMKGDLALQLLVREPAGGLSVSEHQLPFSQILELPSGGDAGDCTLTLELVQLNLLPSDEGGKQMDVQVELLAQAVVRNQCPVTLLEDIYSTSWEMETSHADHRLTALVDSSTSTQNLRELLEVDGTVRKVVDCWCSLGEVVQHREGSRLQLRSDLHIWALYLDESGSLQCHDQSVRSAVSLDCPKEVHCHCHSRCLQEIFATPAAGGIEGRVAVAFDYLLTCDDVKSAVDGGALTELRKRGMGAPSVVLRRGEAGETLWDLAKCYGTTRGEIITANGLDEGAMLPSGMLLIPSVRE